MVSPIQASSIQSVARWGTSTATTGNATPNMDPGTANALQWPNNTTIGYKGYMDNTTGSAISYTFGKNFDDGTSLVIDGQTIMNDNTWNTEPTFQVTLGPGLHTLDLRFAQGNGGVGPTGTYSVSSAWPTTLRATPARTASGCQMSTPTPKATRVSLPNSPVRQIPQSSCRGHDARPEHCEQPQSRGPRLAGRRLLRRDRPKGAGWAATRLPPASTTAIPRSPA